MSQCVREIESRTFVQCCHCGKVYSIELIDNLEDIYINSYCASCGYHKALNCGEDKNDLYNLYNPLIDDRFFIY